MDFDESVIEKIIDSSPSWRLFVQKKEFSPDSVEISKEMIPVKKPSTRGGVYFSETEAYRVRCSVSDPSVVPLLTSTMLGPNTDFTPIEIAAALGEERHTIRANLTNYVQTKTGTRLNMVIVGVSS